MSKHEKKLQKLTQKAYECESREEAQKILKKHNKARKKILAARMINE